MDALPSRLLLLALVCACARQEVPAGTDFTINKVTLMILPATEVQRDTDVQLKCDCDVSMSETASLTYQYSFYKNELLIHSGNHNLSHLSHRLSQVRVHTSGQYSCEVKVLTTTKRSEAQDLRVTGVETPSLKVSGGEIFEGGELNVECSAPTEQGPSSFHFYRNLTLLKTISSTGNLLSTKLRFEKPGVYELYCSYEVMLFRATSENSSREVVSVRELTITPEISFTPSDKITEGDSLKIRCRVRQLIPLNVSLKILVIKGPTVLKSGSEEALWNTGLVQAADAGTYTCKVEANGTQKSVSRSMNVAELFSKPVLTTQPADVFEGEALTFSCKSAHIDSQRISTTDVRYQLYKDNIKLEDLPSGKYQITADVRFNGNYSCWAEVKSIRKQSLVFALKTKVLVSDPLIQTRGNVILGRPFYIMCWSKRGSLPITYTLLFKGKAVGSFMTHSPQDRAIFNMTINSREEIRDFKCLAQNRGDKSKRPSLGFDTMVIVPVSEPQLTATPSTGNVVEGNELILFCTLKDGSPPFTFTLYHDGKVVNSSTTNQRKHSYTLSKIQHKQGGRYYWDVQNNAMESRQSTEITVTVKSAPWKIALIALAIILLLSTITVSLIYCIDKKGKRKEKGTALHVKASKCKPDPCVSVTPACTGYSKASHTVMSDDIDQYACQLSGSSVFYAPRGAETSDDVLLKDQKPAQKDGENSDCCSEKSALLCATGMPAESADCSEGAVDADAVVYAQLNHDRVSPSPP